MLTTDFSPGTPVWLDLGVPDVKTAEGFYTGVFGWNFQPAGPEAGGYGFCLLDGRMIAAIGPLTEQGARPAWMIYFATADADATTEAVTAAGGSVRTAPFDVRAEGRMAQLTDPQGARFAVWQPARHNGMGSVNEPGTLTWTELFTTDTRAAGRFYGTVFGWTTKDMPLPGDADALYTLIATGPEYTVERGQGGMMELPADGLPDGPYWHPVFAVTDCDMSVAKVSSNGGTVRMGAEDVPDVGRFAVVADPFGAEFVVLTPAPM